MPAGGKGKSKAKAKAKAKTKNSKDTLTTLALSRNAAHHGQGTDADSTSLASYKALGLTKGSMVARNSFSDFHRVNATHRAAVLGK